MDEIDELIAKRRSDALTDSLNQGITRQPAAAVEAQRTAASLQVPVDTVERNMDQARRQKFLADLKPDEIVRGSPATAAFLSNPDNAAVAHDDVQNLRDMERISSQLLTLAPVIGTTLFADELTSNSKNASYLGRKFVSGMRYGVPASAAGLVAAVDEAGDTEVTQRQMADAYLRSFRAAHLANPPPLSRAQWDKQVDDLVRSGRFKVPARKGSVAEAALGERDAILRDQAEYVGPTDDIGRMTQMVGGGLESVGTNVLPLLASALIGNPGPMLVGGSLTTGGTSYGEGRSQGSEPATALPYMLRDAIIEPATEYLPGVRLFRDLKAGSPLFKTIINNQIGEQIGEQAATALQDLNAWGSLPENAGKAITDYLAERPGAAIETAVATLVASGAQATTVGAIDAVQQRMNASAYEQDNFDKLLNTAQSSKLRNLDPERFDQFLQSSVGSHTVYIAQDQVAKLYAEGVALTPEIARQLDGSGGDVAVTMRDVLRNPELAVKLRGHIRMSPDGMTTDELKEGGKTLVRDMLARAQNQTIDETEWSVIKEQVLGQLKASGRYNAEDAAKAAELLPAYVSRVVTQYGLTPMEVMKRMNLDIRGPNTPAPAGAPPSTTLDQDVSVAGATPDTLQDARREWEMNGVESPYFRQWFGDSKVVDEKGAPLVVYHGTSSDVSQFGRIEGGNMWGPGYYFTTDPQTASGYATGDTGNRIAPTGNAAPNVMPVYLSLKNPFEMVAPATRETIAAVEKALGKSLKDYVWSGMKNRDLRQTLFEQFTTPQGANDILRKAGFDGIAEDSPTAGKGQTLMAFDPTAIKSAIGNRGTFDATNPSILAQGVTLTDEVDVAETGETVTVEQDAQRLHDQTAKRLDMLRKIQRCLGA